MLLFLIKELLGLLCCYTASGVHGLLVESDDGLVSIGMLSIRINIYAVSLLIFQNSIDCFFVFTLSLLVVAHFNI